MCLVPLLASASMGVTAEERCSVELTLVRNTQMSFHGTGFVTPEYPHELVFMRDGETRVTFEVGGPEGLSTRRHLAEFKPGRYTLEAVIYRFPPIYNGGEEQTQEIPIASLGGTQEGFIVDLASCDHPGEIRLLGRPDAELFLAVREDTSAWAVVPSDRERELMDRDRRHDVFTTRPLELDDGSLIIGDATGRLHRRDLGGSWAVLPAPIDGPIARLVGQAGDRLVVVGAEGALHSMSMLDGSAQRLPDLPEAATPLRGAIADERGVVVYGGSAGGRSFHALGADGWTELQSFDVGGKDPDPDEAYTHVEYGLGDMFVIFDEDQAYRAATGATGAERMEFEFDPILMRDTARGAVIAKHDARTFYYRSRDGVTWERLDDPNPPTDVPMYEDGAGWLYVDERDRLQPDRMQLSYSENGGEDWETRPAHRPTGVFMTSRAERSTLYVFETTPSGAATLWVSRDQGATWDHERVGGAP